MVQSLPGITFHHLQPGDIGTFRTDSRRIFWNCWLHWREQDRVFPLRIVIEPGRNTDTEFMLRVHPDMERPTDLTVLTWVRQVMTEQVKYHVDGCHLRLRYWQDNKEEDFRPLSAR